MVLINSSGLRGAMAFVLALCHALWLVAPVALAQLVFPAGKWELHADRNGAGLFLLADTRIPVPNPADPRRAGSLPLMSVQCEKGKPEFFVNLNYEFELPGGRLPVRYRLDGGEANDAVWRSNNEEGGVAIEPDEPVGFVRALLGK